MQLLRSVTAVVMATNSAAVETFEHAESIIAKRKRQCRENYGEGRARAAYCFQESLEQTFSSPTRIVGGHYCKRHCTQALAGLKAAFAAIRKHPAKVLQNRMASYPTSNKQKLAHQNFTGINKVLLQTPNRQ